METRAHLTQDCDVARPDRGQFGIWSAITSTGACTNDWYATDLFAVVADAAFGVGFRTKTPY